MGKKINIIPAFPALQRTYSHIPAPDSNEDGWNDFLTLLTKEEFFSGNPEQPFDGLRYEVVDSEYGTFIAEYESNYNVFTDIVLNQSAWYTEANGEICKLNNVTKWRKLKEA